jgi:hypothetical protein
VSSDLELRLQNLRRTVEKKVGVIMSTPSRREEGPPAPDFPTARATVTPRPSGGPADNTIPSRPSPTTAEDSPIPPISHAPSRPYPSTDEGGRIPPISDAPKPDSIGAESPTDQPQRPSKFRTLLGWVGSFFKLRK